jgi:hypothetical protein
MAAIEVIDGIRTPHVVIIQGVAKALHIRP